MTDETSIGEDKSEINCQQSHSSVDNIVNFVKKLIFGVHKLNSFTLKIFNRYSEPEITLIQTIVPINKHRKRRAVCFVSISFAVQPLCLHTSITKYITIIKKLIF